MDTLKQQLGSTDEEFAALQPKIEKVQALQRDAGTNGGGRGGGAFGAGGGRRGGGGPGGPGGGGGATTQPVSAVAQAQADLRAALDDKTSTPEVIKSKIDALRQTRGKAKEDLLSAQADLKSVLTQRQEGVLILFGLLD
jgi:hypothetical protein